MREQEPMTKIIKQVRSGQITIPASFSERLGIGPDTLLQVTLMQGELRIRPVQATERVAGSPWLKELYDHLCPARAEATEKGYSDEEINTAIDQAVKAVRKSHV